MIAVRERSVSAEHAIPLDGLSIEEIAKPIHRHVKSALIDYATHEQSAENVIFLFDIYEIEQALKIEHSKTGVPIETLEKQGLYQAEYTKIYDKYIPTTAPSQINISQTLRDILEKEKEKNAFTLASFKIIYAEIKILAEQPIRSFQNSRQYKSSRYLLAESHHNTQDESHRIARQASAPLSKVAISLSAATTAAVAATALIAATTSSVAVVTNDTKHLRLYNMRIAQTLGANASSTHTPRPPEPHETNPTYSQQHPIHTQDTDRTMHFSPLGTPQLTPLRTDTPPHGVPKPQSTYQKRINTLQQQLNEFLLKNQKYKEDDATSICFCYKRKSSNEHLVYLKIQALTADLENALFNWNDDLIGALESDILNSLASLQKIVGVQEATIMESMRAALPKERNVGARTLS